MWFKYTSLTNGVTYYFPLGSISALYAAENGSDPGTYKTLFERNGTGFTLATGYSTLAEANEAVRELVETIGDIQVGN